MILIAYITPPSGITSGGEGDAMGIIGGSINLAKQTAEAWNTSWVTILQTQDSGLWFGLVKLGITLGGISILYLSMTSGKEIIERQAWSELASIFVWPLVIMFFLGSNGNVLAKSIFLTRTFAYQRVQGVLEAQLGEVTFKNAIRQVNLTGIGREQLENLYKECQTKTGAELLSCWESKQVEGEKIIQDIEARNGGPLKGLKAFADNIIKATPLGAVGTAVNLAVDPGTVFRDTAITIVRFILYSLQWAFVNMLEAALLITALFAPIALGLSLLPLQGRPIWAWFSGFISLFGLQLGYNIIVGLSAAILVKSGAELVSDVAFLFFIAVFAPVLASLIAGGGGIALYNGIANNVKAIVDIMGNAIGAATTLIAKRL